MGKLRWQQQRPDKTTAFVHWHKGNLVKFHSCDYFEHFVWNEQVGRLRRLLQNTYIQRDSTRVNDFFCSTSNTNPAKCLVICMDNKLSALWNFLLHMYTHTSSLLMSSEFVNRSLGIRSITWQLRQVAPIRAKCESICGTIVREGFGQPHRSRSLTID